MKSILIIDTPKNCPDCQLMVDGWCYGIPSKEEVQGKIKYLKRPSWCPLKTFPQKIEGKREKFMPTYSLGWNDCLDAVGIRLKAIMGENRMKAVLVIDIPEDYTGSVISVNLYGRNNKLIHENHINKLRPLPHKLQADWYTDGYKEGFNACLEEITGETE